jgi:hypothetical protein
MIKKKRTGLQIRFNPESEQDVLEFFSTLKKSEVHVIAICAFRMYMRSVGFYDQKRIENFSMPNFSKQQEKCKTTSDNNGSDREPEGLVDEDALKAFNSMFENENELNN